MAGAEKGITLMSRTKYTTLRNAMANTVVTGDPAVTAIAAIPAQGGEIDPELMDDVEPDEDDEPDQQEEELEAAAIASELDTDPDTSLVGSVYLHLLGEHGCYDALRLEDDDAIAMHADLHRHADYPHAPADLRFRPGRALAASLLNAETPPA